MTTDLQLLRRERANGHMLRIGHAAWWNPSPTYDIIGGGSSPMETTMPKRGTFDHDGDGKPGGSRPKAERGKPVSLTRGNFERAAQYARKAAADLDRLVAGWLDDGSDDPAPVDAVKALADALTELGE